MSRCYFAYGSNLLESELRKNAAQAISKGVAYLPGFRLAFTKHSETRRGDAASITPEAGATVWGFIYEVNDEELESLRARESGYTEVQISPNLVPDDGTARTVEALTFVNERRCERQCGPRRAYLDLILAGAQQRKLPVQYIRWLQSIPVSD